ncbi:MAG: N-acetylglutaminylglutamine amidotransferase [Gammaproteobacteria bacterium]|nr:N-acetylglutaminylglutamine amidotransferase [Gammaproteobacteria bacterium]
MCGICGELRLDGTSPELGLLNKMLAAIARRGPDHSGSYSDGPLALGHRRLSVIDLSEHANQPMVDPQLSLAMVFNGAIYNYPELRKELQGKGYQFFSSGDSEVILKAFHAWGEQCVNRLQGMFAFAIWDMQKKELFLSRDRLGIKPLYFSQNDHVFRFASNTQALLCSRDTDVSIDPIALHNQLTLHAVIPAPRTLLQGISKLEPGSSMRINLKGEVTQQRYWQLTAQRPVQTYSETEWIERIHDALRLAVRRRMDIADVPVGVLLSGGLDSSLLVALLAEAGVNELRTFSIGFDDIGSEAGSEFEFSDLVANHYGTRHQKYHIPNSTVLPRLPEAVDCMAEPMVGQDAVAFYLLSEQVSQQVRVVQSGQGADELFAGYFWYPQMEAASGSYLERFAKHYFDRSHREFIESVCAQYQGADYTSELVADHLGSPGADEFLDQVLRFDVSTLIVDDPVKRVDNMTMAWGLEARVPFLDHELVELAMQLPPQLKLQSGGKHPLKEIARSILPQKIIDRPKGYFPMPALKYVQGEFLDFMRDILNSQASRERGLFKRPYLDKLLASPETHFTQLQGSKLWHSALLELWLQRNVDSRKLF